MKKDLTRFPSPSRLLACLAVTLLLAGAAAWVLPDFIDLTKKPSPSQMLKIAGIAFFFPALFEEIVFRGVLNARQNRVSIALSTVLFILWHPLAASTLIPEALPYMTDPRFLAFVAIFGVAFCLFRKWTGSLWTPIFCHWMLTVLWKGLGGAQFLT